MPPGSFHPRTTPFFNCGAGGGSLCSTAVVPTATSELSRSSTDVDVSGDLDAPGRIDGPCESTGGRKVAGSNPVAPIQHSDPSYALRLFDSGSDGDPGSRPDTGRALTELHPGAAPLPRCRHPGGVGEARHRALHRLRVLHPRPSLPDVPGRHVLLQPGPGRLHHHPRGLFPATTSTTGSISRSPTSTARSASPWQQRAMPMVSPAQPGRHRGLSALEGIERLKRARRSHRRVLSRDRRENQRGGFTDFYSFFFCVLCVSA